METLKRNYFDIRHPKPLPFSIGRDNYCFPGPLLCAGLSPIDRHAAFAARGARGAWNKKSERGWFLFLDPKIPRILLGTIINHFLSPCSHCWAGPVII